MSDHFDVGERLRGHRITLHARKLSDATVVHGSSHHRISRIVGRHDCTAEIEESFYPTRRLPRR